MRRVVNAWNACSAVACRADATRAFQGPSIFGSQAWQVTGATERPQGSACANYQLTETWVNVFQLPNSPVFDALNGDSKSKEQPNEKVSKTGKERKGVWWGNCGRFVSLANFVDSQGEQPAQRLPGRPENLPNSAASKGFWAKEASGTI